MYTSQKQVLLRDLPLTLTSWATGLQGLWGGTSGVRVAEQFLSSWGSVMPLLLGPGSWRAVAGGGACCLRSMRGLPCPKQ